MYFRLDHGLLSSESEEEDCNDDMEEEHDIEPYPCIQVVTTNAEVNELLSDRPVLVYMDALRSLARANVHHVCGVKRCGQDTHITSEFVSSAVYLKWVIVINFKSLNLKFELNVSINYIITLIYPRRGGYTVLPMFVCASGSVYP